VNDVLDHTCVNKDQMSVTVNHTSVIGDHNCVIAGHNCVMPDHTVVMLGITSVIIDHTSVIRSLVSLAGFGSGPAPAGLQPILEAIPASQSFLGVAANGM
jgi:hypothetical protein